MSLKDYNQAVNDTNAIRKRLLKYVGPSFLTALVFNIVKFFEAKVTDQLTCSIECRLLYEPAPGISTNLDFLSISKFYANSHFTSKILEF